MEPIPVSLAPMLMRTSISIFISAEIDADAFFDADTDTCVTDDQKSGLTEICISQHLCFAMLCFASQQTQHTQQTQHSISASMLCDADADSQSY